MTEADGTHLVDGDLLVDQAIQPTQDAFGRAAIAGREAELATSQPMPLRIALYGPSAGSCSVLPSALSSLTHLLS